MIETWRPVRKYEGVYEVNSHGNVRSVDRSVLYRRRCGPFRLRVRGKQIKPVRQNIYHCVTLNKDGQRQVRLIQYLVLEAFVGERTSGLVVRHLDGNPINNRLENLRYGTSSENAMDILRNQI